MVHGTQYAHYLVSQHGSYDDVHHCSYILYCCLPPEVQYTVYYWCQCLHLYTGVHPPDVHTLVFALLTSNTLGSTTAHISVCPPLLPIHCGLPMLFHAEVHPPESNWCQSLLLKTGVRPPDVQYIGVHH
jgi:hypothetical protein